MKIRSILPFSIAVKVCNDTVWVAGLFSTFLVFSVVPGLPSIAKELPNQVEKCWQSGMPDTN